MQRERVQLTAADAEEQFARLSGVPVMVEEEEEEEEEGVEAEFVRVET